MRALSYDTLHSECNHSCGVRPCDRKQLFVCHMTLWYIALDIVHVDVWICDMVLTSAASWLLLWRLLFLLFFLFFLFLFFYQRIFGTLVLGHTFTTHVQRRTHTHTFVDHANTCCRCVFIAQSCSAAAILSTSSSSPSSSKWGWHPSGFPGAQYPPAGTYGQILAAAAGSRPPLRYGFSSIISAMAMAPAQTPCSNLLELYIADRQEKSFYTVKAVIWP